LPRLHVGSKINYTLSGRAISGVETAAQSQRSVSFYARVVKSNTHGIVLQLADGRKMGFSSKQLHRSGRSRRVKHAALAHAASGNITINIQGLEPGVTVLVTETADAHGNVTITISLPSGSWSGMGGRQRVIGVVSEVDQEAFMVQTADGSDLRIHVAARVLADDNLEVCDTVEVTYHQEGAILVGDRVNDTGSSNAGDCADQQTNDEVGTITQVSGDSITISTQDNGTMTFSVDSADITDGFQVGDVVDVTYTDNGDGTYGASDVEYVEQDTTGTVTALSSGSMTFTDDSSDQPVTVLADPSAGMFDGISVGDSVEVNYHQSGNQLVADAVDPAG
jgi:preprotein translocase subunit YajC